MFESEIVWRLSSCAERNTKPEDSSMACAMLQLSSEAKRRITAAQSTRFDWTKAASIGLHSVVQAHANAVGSPKEFVFLPISL